MSVIKNTLDAFIFLLSMLYKTTSTCSFIYRPVPLHNKNIEIDLLLTWLAQNFSQLLMCPLTVKCLAADIHHGFLQSMESREEKISMLIIKHSI